VVFKLLKEVIFGEWEMGEVLIFGKIIGFLGTYQEK
jgi:hypothetical protein